MTSAISCTSDAASSDAIAELHAFLLGGGLENRRSGTLIRWRSGATTVHETVIPFVRRDGENRPKLPGQRSREPSYRREHLPGEQATQVRLSPLRPEWYPPVAANIQVVLHRAN